MANQFTKKQAETWVDNLIKGNITELSILTNGKSITFTTNGGTKVLGSQELTKGIYNDKNSVLRVNVDHFKNRQGRVVKGQFVEFLYKEVNSLVERHQVAISANLTGRMLQIHKNIATKERESRSTVAGK